MRRKNTMWREKEREIHLIAQWLMQWNKTKIRDCYRDRPLFYVFWINAMEEKKGKQNMWREREKEINFLTQWLMQWAKMKIRDCYRHL